VELSSYMIDWEPKPIPRTPGGEADSISCQNPSVFYFVGSPGRGHPCGVISAAVGPAARRFFSISQFLKLDLLLNHVIFKNRDIENESDF
jgi:hypothetical protein